MGKPETVEDYFNAIAEDRKEPMEKLRACIRENLPGGFEEVLNYGLPGWVVPHSLYEAGYHVSPELPLPFIGIASQKSHIAVYHMGIYASGSLMDWFVEKYPGHCESRLDMGKSCIRFKKAADIPYDLIGELCTKMSPREWIELYEDQLKQG